MGLQRRANKRPLRKQLVKHGSLGRKKEGRQGPPQRHATRSAGQTRSWGIARTALPKSCQHLSSDPDEYCFLASRRTDHTRTIAFDAGKAWENGALVWFLFVCSWPASWKALCEQPGNGLTSTRQHGSAAKWSASPHESSKDRLPVGLLAGCCRVQIRRRVARLIPASKIFKTGDNQNDRRTNGKTATP